MKKLSIILFFGLIILVFATSAFAKPKSVLANDFKEASELYREGNITGAIDAYEKILGEGWESSAIYYNLGNCYFKIGDLARSILNYEKSKILSPRDKSIDFNLSYVRSRLGGNPGVLSKQVGIFGWIVQSLTRDEITIVFSICLLILGTLGLFMFWMQKGRKYLGIVIFVFIFTYCFGFYISGKKNKNNNEFAIVLSDAVARFEPLEEATEHFSLKAGVKVRIKEISDDWIKVLRQDNKVGWILKEKASEI